MAAGWVAWVCLLATTVCAEDTRSAASRTRKKNEVRSAVPGTTTLLSIKEAGSRVEKGDVVCELESFVLKGKLAEQEPATLAAETAVTAARRDRERAEQALVAYTEGTYPQQLQTFVGRISLATSELKRAELRLETTRKGVERGLVPRNKQAADEVAVQRARFNLETLERKKTTLESFTRDKTVKILQGAVEKARSEELIREAAPRKRAGPPRPPGEARRRLPGRRPRDRPAPIRPADRAGSRDHRRPAPFPRDHRGKPNAQVVRQPSPLPFLTTARAGGNRRSPGSSRPRRSVWRHRTPSARPFSRPSSAPRVSRARRSGPPGPD